MFPSNYLILLLRPPTFNPHDILIVKMPHLFSSGSTGSKVSTGIRCYFCYHLSLRSVLHIDFSFQRRKILKASKYKTRISFFAPDSSIKISQTWLWARIITWAAFKLSFFYQVNLWAQQHLRICLFVASFGACLLLFICLLSLLHIRFGDCRCNQCLLLRHTHSWTASNMYFKISEEEMRVRGSNMW